jgi:hypothetical protein
MAAGLSAIITHVMVKWPLRREAIGWHALMFGILMATQLVPSLGQGHHRLLDVLLLVAVFTGISARRLGEPFTTAGVGMLIAFLSRRRRAWRWAISSPPAARQSATWWHACPPCWTRRRPPNPATGRIAG